MKGKPFNLSTQSEKELRTCIAEFGEQVKRLMTIAQLDSLTISTNFDFHTTGKFMGVKISGLKFEKLEILYDQDVKGP